MNTTEKYIAEHEYIFSLKKNNTYLPRIRKINGWSFLGLFYYHLKSLIHCFIYLPIALYHGRRLLNKTRTMKNSAKKKRALLLGNGPSQGFMNVEELDQFVKSGGETYCVNYWNKNLKLSAHIPSWMVFSDPGVYDEKDPDNVKLMKYLDDNQTIKVLVPTGQIKSIQSKKLKNEIYCFIDIELSVWENINPLLPRGYLGLTLYKALAWNIYLGYDSIGVIGMDNTFPKNVYNDKNNNINIVENHAGKEDNLASLGSYHLNIASYYYDVLRTFHHLDYFPNNNIVNLDPYSLTDRFKKVNKDDFFNRLI